jgi:imidazoleglycerol phosphate dehydratase HisB
VSSPELSQVPLAKAVSHRRYGRIYPPRDERLSHIENDLSRRPKLMSGTSSRSSALGVAVVVGEKTFLEGPCVAVK